MSSALAIAIIFGFEPRISYVGKLNPNLPPDETHFYNISPDGVRRDFTRDQFPEDTIIDEGELIDPKSFPSEETRQKVAYLVEGVLSWFTHPKYFEYIHKFALPGSLLYDIVAPKAI